MREYELIIKWSNGDTDIYKYNTRDEAEKHGDEMEKALGEQITWLGVRPCQYIRP